MKFAKDLKTHEQIAALGFALIIVRFFYPLALDTGSILLFVVSGFFAILPLLTRLLPLKTLKMFGVEAEFDKELDRLNTTISKAEMSTLHSEVEPNLGEDSSQPEKVKSKPSIYPARASHVGEFEAIVRSNISANQKMVIVYVLIERILRDFVKEIDPERYRTHRTTRELIDILFLHELITQEEKVAFDQFLEFRNRIIHGQTIVSEDQAARLLDIGWRLVSLLG